MPRCRASWKLLNIICLLLFCADYIHAEDPLHVKVDRLIDRHTQGKLFAEQTDDAAFIRRIYLDFAGRIPTTTETRSFLSNQSVKKRTELIDRLLASPEYANRMQDLFHIWLMERRGDNADWEQFLRHSFTENKPWNKIVQEILYPDVSNEKTRGSIFFYENRLKKRGQVPVF